MKYRYEGIIINEDSINVKYHSGKNNYFFIKDIKKIYIEFNNNWKQILVGFLSILLCCNVIIYFYFKIFIISSILSMLIYNCILNYITKYKLIIKLNDNSVTKIAISHHSKHEVIKKISGVRLLLKSNDLKQY